MNTTQTTPDGGDTRRLLSGLPAVDRVLREELLEPWRARLRGELLTALAREELSHWRQRLLEGREAQAPAALRVAKGVARRAEQLLDGGMRPVLNATGVVLHTGLGRARLPQVAVERVAQILAANTDVEFVLESGARGKRESRAARLLCLLTGAEAALVCNNNAAAVHLMLRTLCARREVIVSRGQQVEIGGGFRIPDVIRESGARLVEVGCTNRTHLEDYAQAIGPRTAAILRVHPSNYRVIGFTAQPALEELSALARERGILLLDDLGSGALVDFPGVPEPEPLVGESLAQGADLLSFSGDKLLGGPQAGIVLGRGDLVARLARHPMMRAFRCDKMTLAALEAVLELYAAPGLPISPVWEACTEERAAARARAGKLLDLVAEQLGLSLPEGGWDRRVGLPGGGCLFEVDTEGRTGSGALPEQDLPGAALALQLPRGLEALHRRLRTGRPALVGQLRDDTLFMDVKALRLEDLPMVASLLARVLE